MVLLFGATAVGKTTLLQRLLRKHNDQYADVIQQDQSVIPSFYVEVPAPDNGKMNWRDINIRTLEQLNEPHLDKKGAGAAADHNGINSADVRRALERAIKNRRNKLGVYDEAQHYTKVTGAKSSQRQQDYIKSLASLSQTFIVLAGTYELLELLPRSGQLARRMLPIHLARYRADVPDDWRTFCEVVLTFQQALPFPEKTTIIEFVEFLYRGSLGCVGLLKCWLNRALALAIESGSKQITLEHLKATILSKPALDRIEEEIRNGEKKASDYDEQGDAFRKIMKKVSSEPAEVGRGEEAKKKSSVIQRKPHRDKVGLDNA
jgi:GTPase SAR1 family protein